MADETPNQNEVDAAAALADGIRRSTAEPSRIDMSPFEAQFTAPHAPDAPQAPDAPAAPEHGEVTVHQLGLPNQRQPGVEWAIEWADGRLTRVHSEAAARFVADRHPRCQVVCRIVGPWGQV